MSILNPLKNILESRRYPLANAQRTTFWQKTWNTFLVFSGNLIPKKVADSDELNYKQTHIGVYDYLTLGIPFLLSALLGAIVRSVDITPLKIFFRALNFIINLPRLIFGVVLTLVCLPIVAVAHAFASPEGEATKAAILAYQVETEDCMVVISDTASLEDTNNCFIFLHNENKLIYKDVIGNLRNVPLKNVSEFRKALDIQDGYYTNPLFGYRAVCISRENLKPFLTDETNVLDTYYNLGQLLNAQGCELEDLEESKVVVLPEETRQDAIRLTLRNNDDRVTSFTLSLGKSRDSTLFGNLRRLNVAGLDNTIEEDHLLSSANLPG